MAAATTGHSSTVRKVAVTGASLVLVTLATAQFLMTLDTSVMNVAIATVAKDVGTTVSGVQTAITLYALVMAALMITGGKVGGIIGRKRAFAIGSVIYGAGSLTTALAGSLGVLIFGWSLLEGIGAALILPAVVALVAANFPPEGRAKAYGLVMAAGAMAVAAGPLIGGLFTTYWSWRYVFAGEVLIVIVILVLSRRIADEPPSVRPHLDVVGVILSASGLALAVFGVLRSGEWGWIQPKASAPDLWGLSLVLWLILGGLSLIWAFAQWEARRERRHEEPLIDLAMLKVPQLRAGLSMFFFQYFVQSGVFFVVPLFLSVSLGLSAIETGVRLLPLSLTLLVGAIGVPRFFPDVSPRLIVRIGLISMVAGDIVLLTAINANASASAVTVPLLLMGFGIGALASQLGSVAVSSVPDSQSPEVGGLQNTATNLGASLGTALAGSVLIATLTTVFLTGVKNNPDVPARVSNQASTELVGGIPFVSDADLNAALDDAHVAPKTADAIVHENSTARLTALRAALAIVALLALVGLFFTGGIPREQPKSAPPEPERAQK
ncbi:MAG TPA: MFS transporter [Gaiellaceae bacterium]|jgi:MFS family permease|nr:MFS transporter [Gaiellaceae bacterium]